MVTNISSEPIDAVIMWVDGADPVHAEKLNHYLQQLGGVRPVAASKTRFHHAGELDYCVTSLLKFAPWLRTIFIVTDNQRPTLMESIKGTLFEQKIKIVDHTEIFKGYESCLPSFNSMASSSLLCKVPGVAEQFLYLNDDFMLIRPVYPEDFFRGEKIVVRGRWRRLDSSNLFKQAVNWLRNQWRSENKKNRISFWGLQQRCAELLGFKRNYFRLPHVPHAWKKSSWEQLFIQYPAEININIRGQLRSALQYVPEGLSAHYHLKHSLAQIDNSRINMQLKPCEQSLWRIKAKLYGAEKKDNIIFACVQSIESAPPEKQRLIFQWLDQRIGTLGQLLKK